MVFQDSSRPFFPSNAQFTNFSTKPGAIVVDKTHFIPLLEEGTFEYMFLRPRRWGKSTFLNMLAAYYDVDTKDSFEEIFGRLHIGKTPTKSRNSHLILLFDFSSITVGSRDEIKQSIFSNISAALSDFLFKYRNILGDPPPEEYIIPNDTAASLQKVLVSKLGAGVYDSTKVRLGARLQMGLHCFRWRRRIRRSGKFVV